MNRAVTALAASLLLAGCRDHVTGVGTTATATAVATAAAVATATATAAPTTTAATATAAGATTATTDEGLLLRAPLVALAPVHRPLVKRGTFEATLDTPEGRRVVSLELALEADPVGYRRALAFHRLARAMGAHVVPVAALRHLGAGELAAAAGGSAEALGLLREARVQNDGTVDALLATRGAASLGSPWEAPSGATPIDAEQGREVAAWERWSASPTPAPGEDSVVLRDYVEMLVLDYLAGNAVRRTALRVGRALALVDNASAFPARPDGPTLDRVLRKLRAAQRFPRGLRERLRAFDRDAAAAAFADGGFETWLLSPRMRVELDERRAALLTLIEARIEERGAEATLSL